MGALLAVLFSGIVFLAYYYGVTPSKEVTVVSQIAEQTFGRNFMYYFIQGTTALILILAANTGYSAFPLLAVNLAKDKFIPRMFTIRGDRLGYSNGIIILGVASIILIVASRTNRTFNSTICSRCIYSIYTFSNRDGIKMASGKT